MNTISGMYRRGNSNKYHNNECKVFLRPTGYLIKLKLKVNRQRYKICGLQDIKAENSDLICNQSQ